jgi:catechol 2,3-dioxygenase-like lactoylglutathione lyase family enzyme
MIGYVTLGTDDLDRSRAYFDALFESIGGRRLMQLEDQHGFTMYGTSMKAPAVVITKPFNDQPMEVGNGYMVAIVMDSPGKVDAFYAKALELGGKDEGAPGFRGDPKFGYYFAYFRDPDGHKFAAFTIAPQA